MALCGIIKHHDKNEKPCVLGFWHFLTSESIAGLSASLSAKVSVTCCFTTRYADFSLYTSDESRTILDNMSDEHL